MPTYRLRYLPGGFIVERNLTPEHLAQVLRGGGYELIEEVKKPRLRTTVVAGEDLILKAEGCVEEE